MSFSLFGCNNSNTASEKESIADSTNESFAEDIANKTETENNDENVKSTISNNTSKGDITIPDLPDNFVECTKYIGQNISTLDINIDQWDFNAYMQDVGKSSLYGNAGTVAMQLGWDDETITNIVLRLDDGEYIQGDEYADISSKLEEIFGESTPVSDGITNYQGKNDYAFRLLRNGAGIAWNIENQEQFNKSNPKNTNNNSDTKETITEEAKRSPEIGMSADEVKQSTWGEPSDINKTTTKYGVREQWVYRSSVKNKYIYFEDGLVTAIQE